MEFSYWLRNELMDRGWSQADLARKSGLSSATLSRIINNTRGAGPNSLAAIARALKLPADLVYRKAGIKFDDKKANQKSDKALYLFQRIQEADQDVLIDLMQVLAEKQEKYSTK